MAQKVLRTCCLEVFKGRSETTSQEGKMGEGEAAPFQVFAFFRDPSLDSEVGVSFLEFFSSNELTIRFTLRRVQRSSQMFATPPMNMERTLRRRIKDEKVH